MKAFLIILCLSLTSYLFLLDSKNPRRSISSTSSQASFSVSGRVPVILKVNLSKKTDLSYTVNTISNNPEGYTLLLKIDAPLVYFENKKLLVQNGEVILSQINSQTESINSFKNLKFEKTPSKIEVSIVSP